MAQALEKVNKSQNLVKMFSFAQKWLQFYKTVFGEIRFSQKSLTNRKKATLTISRQVLEQQPLIISCCSYKPPWSGPHEVRNGREAAVPEKETKILEKGVRGNRGSPEQNQSPDLSIFKNFFSFFLKICKNTQVT